MKKILLFLLIPILIFAQSTTQMEHDKFIRDGNGNVFVSTMPFELAISMGFLDGYSTLDKFGVNPAITTSTDPEDVWEFGNLYTFTIDTGAHYYFSSSSVLDTQITKFYVLTRDTNDNWNNEIITDTLAGQTKTRLVPASGDSIVRIYRIENEDVFDYVGTVYVYENNTVVAGVPQTDSMVRAVVDNGNNQTLMSIYTIPTGYVGFLYRGEGGMKFTGTVGTGINFATLTYQSRRYGKVFKIKKELATINQGNSNYLDMRSFPDPIPAKTDIKINIKEVSEDMGAWATIDILLVEEDIIPEARLTVIGQIKRVE